MNEILKILDMRKFLSIGFMATKHEMSERPKENGWYVVRLKTGKLAWCFYFESRLVPRWNWEEDLSNNADTSKFDCWYTPYVGGELQNTIVEL